MKQNPSSSKKPRRSKSSRKRLQRKQQRTQSCSAFGYENLEPRYALDATFGFNNGNLNLFNFSDGVTVALSGGSITATISGTWTPTNPDNLPNNINFTGGVLTVAGGLGSLTANLGGNFFTFSDSLFGGPVDITNAGLVSQTGPILVSDISVNGFDSVDLTNEDNQLGELDVNVIGDAAVFSNTSISGDTFIAANISIVTPADLDHGTIGNILTTSIAVDAASIAATNVTTTFTSVADDVNNIGRDPISNVRLSATGGLSAIGILNDAGMLISDTPILRDNTLGGITISGGLQSDQTLLQSSNGIDIPINGLDTLYLFLGGNDPTADDFELRSRGEFQLNVPSLQELSVSLFDGFAITSEQDLTIGNFTFTGIDDGDETTTDDEFDDLQFTDAFSDLYANITAVSLTFDVPFQTQKLVADITIDVAQAPGAVLNIDDLYVAAETVILDNINNDFQRIAAVGRGFLADDRQNNEDILTIRDQGTLEIAVLDNLPDDPVVVNLDTPLVPNVLNGIAVAGQVDILTGFGGPIPVQPEGAVEPTFEQLGNIPGNDTAFEIERFEIPRDRSGTQTGVFRDDFYDASVRPVYFIEFIYDGIQDLTIRTDEFERGNPEPVRNFIDIELALYNEFGELVALGQELARELDEIAFAGGALPAGRYFVAASAFSTEFEDDFVVRTSNTQTGTLNVTITGNEPVTPVLSRNLTQAIGASLIVQGGDEPIPEDSVVEFDPNDFPPEILVQLDPNAADFVPAPVEFDPIGDPLPEVDGRATLGALNGGTVQLGLNANNDIRELVVSEAEAVEFADTNDLLVSNLDTPGQSRLAAGRSGVGELTIGDVDSSTLLLQAASGVTQEGVITTDQLLLGGNAINDGGGDFVILSDTLENVAFNLPAGNLALTTSQSLNIAFVQFNDLENPLVPNFIFDESVVSGTARIEAASININTQVQAETLVLNAQDSIVQGPAPAAPLPNSNPVLNPSAPSIVATSVSVSATTVDLNQPQNSITRLAGDVTGSLDLVNQNPIVFATIDNTLETPTRLRPIGVTQTFDPFEIINGLTVVDTANITTGLTADLTDGLPPVSTGLSVVTINPIVVSNDDGTNTAQFFGNAVQEAQIKELIDVIYAQAGIDIEFLPTVFYNNTFANIGDGSANRPGADLTAIVTAGDADGVGSPDPNVIDLYAVQTTPGAPTAIGIGFLNNPGNAIQSDFDLSTVDGRALTAVLAGHEIGHNLGLPHVIGELGNLLTPTIFASPPATINAEQATIIQGSPLVGEVATTELLPIVGGFTQEFDAPLNIGSANFTALNDGDIVLLNPGNDINFNSTDARDVNVQLVDGSTITSITADRDLTIQTVGELTIAGANTLNGNVTINTGGDVLIGEVDAIGSITVTSGGSINDFQGDVSATGTITLIAANEIDGIDLADQSVVVATANTGDISLLGLDQLTLQTVTTSTGAINITTAGDLLVGSVNSASTIDVASSGSINDLQDDLVADFSAVGLVTLNAIDEIGGGATPTNFDFFGQLEFGPNTLILQSTEGGIVVGGDGPLIFQDIKTPAELVIFAPDSLTLRNVMALNANLSAFNDITIESIMTVNETVITAGGNLDIEDVLASSATLTAGGILDVVNVTTTGDATLVATGDLNATTVISESGVASLASGGVLTAGSVTGIDATLISVSDLNVDTVISTVGDVNISSGNDINAGTVTAQNDANLTAVGNIATNQDVITIDGVATLISGGSVDVSGIDVNGFTIDAADDITIGDLTVVDSISLTSSGAIETGDISATFVVLDTGTSLETGNVTATTGNVKLTSAEGQVTGDVTADNGDIIIDSGQVLVSGVLAANNVTVTSGDNANIAAVSAVASATINSQGVLNVATVDADTASLTAAQNVTFETVNTVGDVVLTAGDGNLNGNSVVSTTGTVSLSSLQRVNVSEATSFGDVTLEAGNAVNTDLVVSQTGSATINSNSNLSARVVEAAVDAILITPRSDISSDSVTAGVSAQLTSGAFLFTRNVEAPAVALNAGTNQVAQRVIADTAEITAVGDLGLNDIQVGQLTIAAGDDIFDAGFLDGNRVTTENLIIRAGNSNNEGTFGGVVLETDVDTLTVITEGESFGNIIIRELDDIVLGEIQAGNGGINISAGGTISGGNLRTVVQNDSNDVRLIATGDASDIRVDSIDVGSIGDAFLIADDDVVITGGGQLTADFIFVSANNRSVGGTEGIALTTNIRTADLVVGNRNDANQNRGDISITDVDTLNLNFARTLNGTISATANGNLVTSNIQSEGLNVADAISLRAIGSGADVVTNRVAVVQQAGGVVLTAGDDVRDANPRDNRLIVADNLTIVAGNNLTDTFDGINSQSRVRSINATVGSTLIPDGDQEGLREANILLNNIGQLTINEANLSSGLIRVINNNGFLTINDVNLTSSSSDNRVFIQTTGNGSDIAVGSLNAGSRGTVIIDSADDIFDTNQLDDLFVEGGFLSATSQNGTDDPFDGIILNVDVDDFVSDAQLGGIVGIRQRG